MDAYERQRRESDKQSHLGSLYKAVDLRDAILARVGLTDIVGKARLIDKARLEEIMDASFKQREKNDEMVSVLKALIPLCIELPGTGLEKCRGNHGRRKATPDDPIWALWDRVRKLVGYTPKDGVNNL